LRVHVHPDKTGMSLSKIFLPGEKKSALEKCLEQTIIYGETGF
jgi:hypothetical protein